MLIIGHVNGMNETYDENWMIVQSPGAVVPRFVAYVPELSPSPELFALYRRVLQEQKFSKEWFQDYYVPTFINDLATNPEAIRLLHYLCDVSDKEDYTIFVCCFCEDEEVCHCSIVSGILDGMEAKIDHVQEQYRRYFSMFQNRISETNVYFTK